MRIILPLLIVFLNSCTEQPGAKYIVTEKGTYGDSLKTDLIGLWKGPGENGWIWDIRTDSVRYYQFKAVYSYQIKDHDLIIDLPGSKDTLRNITVNKDTMFFFDERGSLTKAFRVKDSIIRFVPIAGVVADSLVTEDMGITEVEHKFRIISVTMHLVDTASGGIDLNACDKWKLSKKDILDIFRSSKPISGTEWDLAYAVMPCSYKGKFLMDGKKGNYEINAGSYVILTFKDTTLLLGCISGKMNKYFLEHPNY